MTPVGPDIAGVDLHPYNKWAGTHRLGQYAMVRTPGTLPIDERPLYQHLRVWEPMSIRKKGYCMHMQTLREGVLANPWELLTR